MRTTLKLILSGLTVAAGALLAGQAQAHDDVQWSVTIGNPVPGVVVGAPVYGVPAPVYGAPAYRVPAPVYREPHWRESRYREPTRWDRDGDGIPNRYDRVYNPRWDRDGDGVPNRYDRHPNYEARNDGRWNRDGRRW